MVAKLRQTADELERGFTQQKEVSATAALDDCRRSAVSRRPASRPCSPHFRRC